MLLPTMAEMIRSLVGLVAALPAEAASRGDFMMVTPTGFEPVAY
jgi:hypothetical protein